MENLKHHPAPWFAVPKPFYFDIKEGPKLFDRSIATVNQNRFLKIYEDEMKANALLIAASPELLNVLIDIWDIYKKDGHLLNLDVSNVRRAINKATGIEYKDLLKF